MRGAQPRAIMPAGLIRERTLVTDADLALKTPLARLADWLRRNRTAAVVSLSSLAFVAVAFAIYRITEDVRYGAVLDDLTTVSWARLGLAVLFTFLSFGFLICYDVNALRHIGRKLPLGQVVIVSFSAYAVGNTAGFGPLSGGAIRYRGYSRMGLSGEEIARVIAFVTVAFGLGLALLTGVSVLFYADQVAGAAGYSPLALRGIALAILAALVAGGAWLWHARRREEVAAQLPPLRDFLMQFLVTAGDVAAAATVLYVLLPAGLPIGWPAFAALFCLAIGLGVLSHVPAGLGVFEAVILAGLGPAMPTEQVVGAVVLYRLVYHVMPLFLAVLAFTATELLEYRNTVAAIWTRQLSAAVIPPLLSVLALVTGVMLVFSAVLPTRPEALEWISALVPLQLLESAHFLSSVLGLLLVVIARGLVHRLDGAFWAGLVVAGVALALSFLKAVTPYEAVFLAVLLAGLLLNRHSFSRRASLLAEPLTPAWIGALAVVVAAAVMILFIVYRDVDYDNQLWWQFTFDGDAPRGLRAAVAVALVAAVIALASLLRPARHGIAPASAEEIARAVDICAGQDNSGGNLVRMADKALMFSGDGSAFLMYDVQGKSWISLFGPIGDPEARAELVWRFVEAARASGGRPVFYQVPPSLLAACADAGLRALKLGEMAVVDLSGFDLKSSRWGETRRALAQGARDGKAVEVLLPAEVPAVLDELEAISDSWLAHHQAREKGFALGRFERDFVASQPVAVLRFQGEIVAFATLLLTDTHAEATVDLMRFGAAAPRGAMDFLFGALMDWSKAQGYRTFNLGMAPLSGFSTHSTAPIWNHVGEAIFTHGEKFYNFKGLRAFKAKYNPDWEPRYLVVGGAMSPVAALVDVTLLIGGGIKGVVGK